jgi:hypothetical protein
MTARGLTAKGLAIAFAVFGIGDPGRAHAGSVTYEILADTSGLAPGPNGSVDILLTPDFPQSPPTVSVDVFHPITDGTLGGSTPLTGTAMGDLTSPGGVTADNSAVTNELTQDFSVGSFFDVFVTLSGPEVGPGAIGPWSGTEFGLTLFDSAGDLVGATLIINPNRDQHGNPIVDGTVGIDTTGPVQAILASVPEPSGVVLLGLGLTAIAGIARLGRTRDRTVNRRSSDAAG